MQQHEVDRVLFDRNRHTVSIGMPAGVEGLLDEYGFTGADGGLQMHFIRVRPRHANSIVRAARWWIGFDRIYIISQRDTFVLSGNWLQTFHRIGADNPDDARRAPIDAVVDVALAVVAKNRELLCP